MTTRVPSITYNWEEYVLGNEYTAGTGISITDNEIANDWVTSVNWITWAVTVTSDVVVSSQSNNVLTSWMAIRAWTETNYNNLGTRDSNTLYLTIE